MHLTTSDVPETWPGHTRRWPRGSDPSRWTHQGLQRLVESCGGLKLVEIEPHRSTPACLAQLASLYVERATRYTRWRRVAKPAVAAINRLGVAADRRFPELEHPHPDALIATFLVIARRTSQ